LNSFNPFRCTTEVTRRLSVGLLIISLLAWGTWVGFVSDGFTEVKPIGWLIFFGAPIAVYLALLAALPLLRMSPREVRLLVSANLMWIFLVGTWGFIWQWENMFSLEQYLALFVLPSIGAWLAFLLWKWTKGI
jgi:hypothetical protein